MSHLEKLDSIIRDIIAPAAIAVDRDAAFSRAAISALGKSGLLGLMSATKVGGLALMAGEIDAAWMIEGNYIAFSGEGILPAGATRIVARMGAYDHCNFTEGPGAPAELVARFVELLLGMDWDNPEVRPLLELEGLKSWRCGRTSGYSSLERAVDDEKFYDTKGNILSSDYRY